MNMTIYDNHNIDGLKAYTHEYSYLLDKDIPVFILDADFDMMDGPVGTQAWMN
jgi:hypothetical protein